MLGVDTNVLVRFLSDDDQVQSSQARSLFANPINHPIYLSMLVLAEAFTVMTKVKKYPSNSVLDSYRLLMRSPQVRLERPDMVAIAIDDATETRAGFPDALIALQNAEAGCATSATFDVRALRLASMEAVKGHL